MTRKVFHLSVNKLIASSGASHRAQCAAQLVSAPQESLPHIFEVVTRAKAAQSLSTPGTEPVKSLLQPRPTRPESLRLTRLVDVSTDLLLVFSLCDSSPGREDLALSTGPESSGGRR